MTILWLIGCTLLAATTEVVVTLKDGGTVSGSLNVSALKMKTSFGEASIDLAHLRSIELGEVHTVTTDDGTTLRGKLSADKLVVDGPKGRKTLKLADISKVECAAGLQVTPGAITDGTASNGLTYHVRVPKSYPARSPLPAILILHGSNMSSKAYVHTIAAAWPQLAEEYVLLGIDGEQRNKDSDPKDPTFNYTYVNWCGPRCKMRGSKSVESPPLVLAALQEIRRALPMSRVFVGGHSQGAFLTYMLVMNFPEEFAGAFPIAGGLIFQAEPAAYEDAAVVAAQRRVPIAIVHAPNDPVVEYSSSQHAWEAFDEAGFPALRLFDDTQAGHMFAHLPIEEALRWLEAHASDDPERLLAFAAQRSGQEGERDAAAALGKARRLDAKKALKSKLDAAAKKLDADAAKAAKPLVLKMGQGGAAWADEFFAFRTRFGLLEAAKPVLDAYAALRKVQQGPAEAVYRAARADFDQGRRDAGYTKCAEIVEKYPAFEKYRLVRRWSREKK